MPRYSLTAPNIVLVISRTVSKLLKHELTSIENLSLLHFLATEKQPDAPDIATAVIYACHRYIKLLSIRKGIITSATSATNATNATNATSATSATSATGATNATSATSATSATNANDSIDIHELLIQQMRNAPDSDAKSTTPQIREQVSSVISTAEQASIKKIFNTNSIGRIQDIFNRDARYVRNYIILNTQNEYYFSPDQTHIRWNYMDNALVVPGVVSTLGIIRDIVGMRLQPIKINVNSVLQNIQFPMGCDFLTVAIEEFTTQAFVGPEGRRFHFMCMPDSSDFISAKINLNTHFYNRGWFWFHTPITRVDSFTISLGAPYGLLNLLNSPLSVSCYPLSVSGSAGYTNPMTLYFNSNDFFAATLQVGKKITCLGFNTTNPIADAALITAVNNPSGNTILSTYAVTINSNPTIAVEINVDASIITDPNQTINFYTLGAPNLFIMIELIMLRSEADSI